MIIDTESLADLTLALKVQSDYVVLIAAHLDREAADVSPVLRYYVKEINDKIGTMVDILTAVKEENHAVAPPCGTAGRA